jgi:negative regulator of flagellin synthesis FlgM
MKIGQVDKSAITAPVKGDRQSNKAENTPVAEPSAKVELSSVAASFSAENPDAEFDAAKVERIAQAIRDGKFQVNAEKIADKLIANSIELLSGPESH